MVEKDELESISNFSLSFVSLPRFSDMEEFTLRLEVGFDDDHRQSARKTLIPPKPASLNQPFLLFRSMY